MKSILVVVVVGMITAILPHISHSAQYWYKTYGGNNNDYAQSIQQTADGGYVVAGYTNSFDSDESDAWVMMLDANGEISWQRSYRGSDHDFAESVQQTSDGNIVVLVRGTPYRGIWLQKLDSGGDIIWQKDYGNSVAQALQQTSDGGYIVAGTASTTNAFIIKLDSEGNVIWRRYYLFGEFTSIQQTTDGGYIVAGNYWNTGPGFLNDFWVLKLDSNGNITWQKRYGGSNNDSAQSIQQTADGGYVVAGYVTNRDLPGDFWVLKLDNNGDISWQKNYDRGGSEFGYCLQQTTDGGYIVTGTSGFGLGTWIIKLDSSGNVIWQKIYYGLWAPGAYSTIQTSDGGYVVVGADEFGLDGHNVYVLKIDSNGDIPGCNITETTESEVTETDIQAINTTITAETGSLYFNETKKAVQDTTASMVTVCSSDDDDGIPYNEDNCPSIANPDQDDSDEDNVGNVCDNCPDEYNPGQEDTYPTQGNGIGDACDCEADFNCDGNVDATDVDAFLTDFGRSTFFNPCTNASPCNGDVDCNGSCDANDVSNFLEDFGRSQFNNPCPPCVAGDWCVYP